MSTGDPVSVEGTLVRHAAGFALRVAGGRLFQLQLQRTPVDHVERRVKVTGVLLEGDVIEADGVVRA